MQAGNMSLEHVCFHGEHAIVQIEPHKSVPLPLEVVPEAEPRSHEQCEHGVKCTKSDASFVIMSSTGSNQISL